MLHKSNVEWPCMSIDTIIRDRSIGGPMGLADCKRWFPHQVGGNLDANETVFDKRMNVNKHVDDKYPMTVYFAGGSQCVNKNENKIYVMKWSEMEKTLRDDEDISDDDIEL